MSEVVPVKRGRKKKTEPVVNEKKKRGRKPAFEYYTTSACKRNTNKKSEDANNTIIQLDISDTEETSTFEPNDTEDDFSRKFKVLDIVERFYNELQKDNETSLEELYNTELVERKKQDTEFFETLDKQVEEKKDELTKGSDTNIKTCSDTNYVGVLCDFIDVDWPHTTSVLCWWCCNNFTGVPVGVPTKYNQKTRKFTVKGIFCGMNCMYAYTLDYTNICSSTKRYKFNVKHEKISNLDSLVKDMNAKLTGASIGEMLTPALPRESLIDFGGELSIDAFRAHSKNGRIFSRIDYPFTVVKDIIEIKDIEKMKKYQEKRNEGTDKIDVKIMKPIQRQTIDSILNLEYD